MPPALGLDVPRDLSVVGFDDLPQAEHSFPGLATVCQPLYRMGQLAARIVADQLEGERPLLHRIQLQTELVVRSSTGSRPTQ
jgi:DNA-binding LacI/PurR family transcriptional regulator